MPLAPVPAVASLLEAARSCSADYKVVEAENFHATVKFLGDIPDAQASIVLQHLRSAGLPSDYVLGLRGVGAFPDWKRLNVVWIGLEDPSGALARTFEACEAALAGIGFPSETRAFAAHATIARKRSERHQANLRNLLAPHRQEHFGEVTVRGPNLYRSTLTPTGPKYESLGACVA